MDPAKVISVLEGTMSPALRKEAEAQLDQMHKIAGFTPLLLQLIMADEVVMAVRQSGAIYLKNMCSQSWHDRTDKDGTPLTNVFSIHENDRVVIRENVVEAIIHAPDIIRSQLTVIVSNIIKYDYPEKWPAVIDKISIHLQSNNHRAWMGALMTLYQLVKNYEFKKVKERGPLIAAMKIFFPIMLELFNRFVDDNSAVSALLQKQLLKILYALVQYSLPVELFNEGTMDRWIKLMKAVVERPVPDDTLQVDELERPELPWWKCKKWAMHFLARVFERYGSPGTVMKEYNDFSEFFLKRYAVTIVQVTLKVLDAYRRKAYISPRVLQKSLHVLEQSVSHALTWKIIKNPYQDLLKDIIYPLMCFTDEDQEVWEDDPHEYIRMKFDVFQDFLSPASAAQCFMHSACTKRQQVLQKTMGFCYNILTQTRTVNTESSRNKDGALHVIGSLADTLLKRKMYKDQLELLLVTHVTPELKSEYGYLRARACWVIQRFSEVKFKKKNNVIETAEGLKDLLTSDTQLPTRVEAAMAIQSFLSGQEVAEKHCIPHVQTIIQALLQLVHETENEDLTTVVQKVVCLYCEQVIPYAVDITQNLTVTFLKVLNGAAKEQAAAGGGDVNDGSDDKAVTAMSILSTIETILDMMEEEREITIQLESIIAPLVAHVLKNRLIDFYEEIFSLMYSLTCQAISSSMWEALPLIAEVFEDDGFDYFTEMMPCLHNFCTIDTQTLLSNPKHLEIIYSMCKKVLETEEGEDPVCHAAKLLEVVILQCRGQIDQCIPLFVEAALARLTREVKSSELRTMCLQVVVAALFCNPSLLLQTLDNMRFPNTTETISEQFFRQWITDVDCFLGIHDRRMCVLGLCTLINLDERPSCVAELTPQIIPSLIMLFQGLVRAYKVYLDIETKPHTEHMSSFQRLITLIQRSKENCSPSPRLTALSFDLMEGLSLKRVTRIVWELDHCFLTTFAELVKGEEEHSNSTESSDNEDDDDDGAFDHEELASDEDEIDEESAEYLEMLQKKECAEDGDSIFSDEETDLESFTTFLEGTDSDVEEFSVFKASMHGLRSRDPVWYDALLAGLSNAQRTSLDDIYVLADQRMAAAESKKIEKTGGYQFANTSVPSTFNFASSRPSSLSP